MSKKISDELSQVKKEIAKRSKQYLSVLALMTVATIGLATVYEIADPVNKTEVVIEEIESHQFELTSEEFNELTSKMNKTEVKKSLSGKEGSTNQMLVAILKEYPKYGDLAFKLYKEKGGRKSVLEINN